MTANEASLPGLPRDSYGAKFRLNPCRRPKVPVVASGIDTSDAIWALFTDLEAVPGVTVVHGKIESLICFAGVRLGGVDREAGHCFVYENFGTYLVDGWLRRLGFEKQLSTRAGRRSGTDGSAYADHSWYQVDLREARTYLHVITEIAREIAMQQR